MWNLGNFFLGKFPYGQASIPACAEMAKNETSKQAV
jgi:hypothetical protein